MLKTLINDRSGFEVLHNSEGWRMAIHAYNPDVNGIPSLKNWGRHMDSQEAFLLLKGEGYLATADDSGNYFVEKLTEDEIRIVEAGERHAIILKEGAAVLIVENEDMSNSVNELIDVETRHKILTKMSEKN